jgi:hypothetical protein
MGICSERSGGYSDIDIGVLINSPLNWKIGPFLSQLPYLLSRLSALSEFPALINGAGPRELLD